MGHALEFVEADCIAKYHRMVGDTVYFLTGTDEHGSKIVQTAEQQNIPVKKLIDQNVKKFKAFHRQFGISYDDFIRTTDKKRHWPSVRKLWNGLVKNGDIYKGIYKGLYCVGCEEYKNEKDLIDGKCPNHEKAPEYLEQENYFFRLSKYSHQIAKILQENIVEIIPEFRKNEIIALCERGLEDVSFSRPKKQLPWGVPVPDDKDQVMYVWCDALTNYISAMDFAKKGKIFQKYWPIDVHVIGKDILRFHAGVWIGMLLSAKIPLPKQELVHGWIHFHGDRMSKSKGNVVDPVELANHYGVEKVRFYLLSEIPVGQDGDFSYELFEKKINADLSNNLGNFVNRVFSMVERYLNSSVPQEKTDIPDEIDDLWEEYHLAFTRYDHQKAAQHLIFLVNFGNKLIADQKPWEIAQDEKKEKELRLLLRRLLKITLHLAFMLEPFCPATAKKILKAFSLQSYLNAKGLVLLEQNKLLYKSKKIKKIPFLFARVEASESLAVKDVKKTRPENRARGGQITANISS